MAQAKKIDYSKYKILFVDDDHKVLNVARKIMRKAGFQVKICDNAMEAADIVANEGSVSIIFTDNKMTGMRGTELLEIVKRVSPHTVRVLTTANYDPHLAEEVVNKGEAFRLLKKPIDFSKLGGTLQQCVKQYELNIRADKVDATLQEVASERDELDREAAGLSKRIDKMKKTAKKAAIAFMAVLVLGSAVYLFKEYQRKVELDASSHVMGTWVVYDNHTALDTVNHLMWMTQDFRMIEKRFPGSWNEAMAWSKIMNSKQFAGYSDWRVPSISEYKSTFDPNRTKLAYDNNKEYPVGYPKAFENGGGYGFWSTERVGEKSAKYFFFVGGYDKTEGMNYTSPTMSVRLVRTAG